MSVTLRFLALLALAAVCLALPATESVAQNRTANQARPQQQRLNYPPAPRAGYTPRDVHQRYNNCAFASAEMLIDKWTEGRVRPPQQALRTASGIAPIDGGPTLGELRRAVAKVADIDMRWSPHGGDPLTWQQLLDRLGNGGGALVNVWPVELPAHYRRWLPTLTAGHSVYVERYQPRNDRLWLIDPLGRGLGFRGEWIDADDLYRAMWRSGGHVWAAATPQPPRDPSLADFELGTPQLAAVGFSDALLDASIRYAARRPDAVLPELRLFARWEPVADEQPDEQPVETPTPEAAADPVAGGPTDEVGATEALDARLPTGLQPIDGVAVPATPAANALAAAESTAEPARPFESLSEPLTSANGRLHTDLVTPPTPGDYRIRLEFRDADGQPSDGDTPTFGTVSVQLRGPLAGTAAATTVLPESAGQGEVVSLTVEATNLGSAAWGETKEPVSLAVSWDGGPPTTLALLKVPSGRTRAVPLTLFVDAAEGRRTVRLTMVDATGALLPESAPIDLVLEVTRATPGRADIH